MTETVERDRPNAQADEGRSIRPDLPVYECEYCGAPFAREAWLALHRGLEHPEALDAADVEAFREAHAAEEAALRRFRLKALGTLVALYFGLLMVYAVV